jgi:hypothetical protein
MARTIKRDISDFAERYTVDPALLLEEGTVVRLTTSGAYEIIATQGSASSERGRVLGIVYALDRTTSPYIAMIGKCFALVRGSVSKGDLLVLNDSHGKLSSSNGASPADVVAIAMEANSLEHGKIMVTLKI